MLAALAESQQAQQQLIADASHELRTPLAAHRANIELLARPDLPVEQRQRVLGGAVRAMERLSALVGDLIVAARDGRSVDAREPLALDELVAAAVERAQHRASKLHFESRLEPYGFVGARSRLERTVDNALDNAIKWSPPGGTVEVRLTAGTLTVRDHGPGIAEADLPHVFDRFYRAPRLAPCPARGSGSRSSSRPSTTTEAASPPPTRTAEGRSSRSASTPTADRRSLSKLSATSHTKRRSVQVALMSLPYDKSHADSHRGRRRHRLAVSAPAVAASSSTTVATTTTPTRNGALAYARCMRSHGVGELPRPRQQRSER